MNNFNSKKFAAFLISLIIIAGILGIALFTQSFGWAMAGFMSIGILGVVGLSLGYILAQRRLDSIITLMSDVLTKKNKE